jgi:hypothetical protein
MWSLLAQGGILADPVITALSRRYGKTPAQIVLRWHIDLGNAVIPKSVTHARIRENIDIVGFLLDAGYGHAPRSTTARGPARTLTAPRSRPVSRAPAAAGCLMAPLSSPEDAG